MNTIEFVKLTSDSNYIPVKYAVMEATIGSSTGNSYVWLKCVGQGVATLADFNAVKTAINNYIAPDNSKIIGTLGGYSVVAISAITPYSTPARFSDAGILLG